MPRTAFMQAFHCVTGWRVPRVHWAGVQLSTLLDLVAPTAKAKSVRFTSFDGTYTESLTMAEARHSDVVVALEMLGQPVAHDHGGPVRMYAGSMYGYKSTKWLSGIELTGHEIRGSTASTCTGSAASPAQTGPGCVPEPGATARSAWTNSTPVRN